MELVKRNPGYKRQEKIKKITLLIADELRKHPDHLQCETNMSIINFSCNLIEELVNKKYNIDKFKLLVDIFKLLLNKYITNSTNLKISVDYLIDNGLIKHVKFKRKAYSYIKNIIISNFFFSDK